MLFRYLILRVYFSRLVDSLIQTKTVKLVKTSTTADWLGTAKIYRYPDAEGQTKEELIKCYKELYRGCGRNDTGKSKNREIGIGEVCEPDDDKSPWSSSNGKGYLPEDLAEMYLLPSGNIDEVTDKNIDSINIFVVNPSVHLTKIQCYRNETRSKT